MAFSLLDYIVFISYFLILIGLSIYWGRGQKNEEDYYVSGRNLPWWAVGISTAATQTSAIGFMSVPAFIALKEGGGLKLIQGEFALPLAMIFIMVLFIPFFRKLKLISIYDYLDKRFGYETRYLIAGVFLFSRGLGTAVGLYMTAIVFSTVTTLPLSFTIIIIAVVTVIYDSIGGMRAVVYSDVVQMVVLFVGAFLILFSVASDAGGLVAIKEHIATHMADRIPIFEFSKHGFGDGGTFSFLPQLIGGFFLLASYYGCDQTQTQRELSAATLADTKRSLVFNGFFRFPLTLLYSSIGLCLGVYVALNPEFYNRIISLGKVDYMVPLYIMESIPQGIKALIFVAVLAAAMSSLDSSINSLSATTMTDFLNPLWLKKRSRSPRSFLLYSKITTVLWGIIITIFAFYVGRISDTVIEAIGIVGSAFYGPILASFIAGVLFKFINKYGMLTGIIIGVGFNLILHNWYQEVFWMWWNAIGCIVTLAFAFFASWIAQKFKTIPVDTTYILNLSEVLVEEKKWVSTYGILIAYFIFMLVISWGIQSFLR